jgi:hypothetical protein
MRPKQFPLSLRRVDVQCVSHTLGGVRGSPEVELLQEPAGFGIKTGPE